MTSLIDSRQSNERVEMLRSLAPGSSIHIIGICGTGTAQVAMLLKSLGFQVSGSDKAFYPPMDSFVRTATDRVFTGYAAANLEDRPIDLAVIGNSIRRDNPEVEYVLAKGIPYVSMPEVLAAKLIGTREECPCSIVVCGTHGKTTTSAATAVMLNAAGRKPGYFIGGAPLDLSSGIQAVDYSVEQAKRVVVLEGDEYDSAFFAKWAKFLSYRPDIVVITSIEFDHADIYSSLADIEQQFARLVQLIPKSGLLLVWDGDHRARELVERCKQENLLKSRVAFYGSDPESPNRILHREVLDGRQRVRCIVNGTELEFDSPLVGEFNALNLLASATVGASCGLTKTQISTGLSAFNGVRRRQQVLAQHAGILVLEDFAHHPTAVRETLKGLSERYTGRRLVAVFEPRSNTSRRSFFQHQYPNSFLAADLIFIQEVLDAGDYSATGAISRLDVEQIVRELQDNGKSATMFSSADEAFSILKQQLRSGDVVVLMSNGDFQGLPGKIATYVSQL